jgi:ABC-type phosphate transport system permease subunit
MPGSGALWAMGRPHASILVRIVIRFVFRFIGFFVLAAAFVALLYDGTKTIAADQISITPLEQIWAYLDATSLQRLKDAVSQSASVWVWDSLFATVLTAPAALVLAVLGALLMLIGRKKRPLIGYSR